MEVTKLIAIKFFPGPAKNWGGFNFGREGEGPFKPETWFRVIKAETKDTVKGWQNAGAEVQKFVNAVGKSVIQVIVVKREEI